MSLVHEYLKKTQAEHLDDTGHVGVVPPILTGGRRQKRPTLNVARLIVFGITAGVAAAVVIKAGPYLWMLMSPQTVESQLQEAAPPTKTGPEQSRETAALTAGNKKEKPAVEAVREKTALSDQDQSSTGRTEPAPVVSPSAGPIKRVEAGVQIETGPSREAKAMVEPARPTVAAEKKPKVFETTLTRESSSLTAEEVQAALDRRAQSPSGPVSPAPSRETESLAYAPSMVSVSSRSAENAGREASRTAPPKAKADAEKKAPPSPQEKQVNYYEIGLAAQKSGDLAGAEKYYQAGLKQNPADINLLTNLSAVYIRRGNYVAAADVLRRARQLEPRNVKLLINLGILELKQKRHDQAKLWFGEALKINPSDEVALTNLAYLAQLENNLSEMEDYYQRIISISPNDVEVLLAYASVLERKQEFVEAAAVYQKCLKLENVRNNSELNGKIRSRINLLAELSRGRRSGGDQ